MRCVCSQKQSSILDRRAVPIYIGKECVTNFLRQWQAHGLTCFSAHFYCSSGPVYIVEFHAEDIASPQAKAS